MAVLRRNGTAQNRNDAGEIGCVLCRALREINPFLSYGTAAVLELSQIRPAATGRAAKQ